MATDHIQADSVAALYDIHGNLPALEAVMHEVRTLSVDLLLFGGDLVWGPWSREVVELIRSTDKRVVIRGNADREVAGRLDASDGLDEEVAAVNLWSSDQLSVEQREWLVQLPEEAIIWIDGIGETLFCHGSPRSDEEILTPATSDERLTAALRGVTTSTVVCGHTHIQFEREINGARVVNAGSVGLPYEDDPGAYWVLLGPDVSLRRTAYDVEKAAALMRTTKCPNVDEMFATTIERPPNRDETIEHFESIAQQDTLHGYNFSD